MRAEFRRAANTMLDSISDYVQAVARSMEEALRAAFAFDFLNPFWGSIIIGNGSNFDEGCDTTPSDPSIAPHL
jgi:hypothetical protein